MKEIPELHKSYRRTLRINRKKINSYSDIVHDGYAKLQVYRDYHTKKVYHEEAKARAVAAVKRFKDEITQLKKTKPDITKLIGLEGNEILFKQIVKTGFNQRRKKLSNALKPLNIPESLKNHAIMDKRAEELSVEDFINFTIEWKTAN